MTSQLMFSVHLRIDSLRVFSGQRWPPALLLSDPLNPLELTQQLSLSMFLFTGKIVFLCGCREISSFGVPQNKQDITNSKQTETTRVQAAFFMTHEGQMAEIVFRHSEDSTWRKCHICNGHRIDVHYISQKPLHHTPAVTLLTPNHLHLFQISSQLHIGRFSKPRMQRTYLCSWEESSC